MNHIFSDCSSLTRLDLSNFNTDQVEQMGGMFSGCSSLEALDITHFNTSSATTMTNMFWNCSSLIDLDVTHFNTSNVTDMSSMFFCCEGLVSLDLSSFDAGKVSKIYTDMFTGCSNLTKICTPLNLTLSARLPVGYGTWYNPDGKVITELPQNLSYSIEITKEKIVRS